jgi:hypothetical protein
VVDGGFPSSQRVSGSQFSTPRVFPAQNVASRSASPASSLRSPPSSKSAIMRGAVTGQALIILFCPSLSAETKKSK